LTWSLYKDEDEEEVVDEVLSRTENDANDSSKEFSPNPVPNGLVEGALPNNDWPTTPELERVIATPDRGGTVDDNDGCCWCVGTDKEGDKEGGAVIPNEGCNDWDIVVGVCKLVVRRSDRYPDVSSVVGIDEVLDWRPLTPKPKLWLIFCG